MLAYVKNLTWLEFFKSENRQRDPSHDLIKIEHLNCFQMGSIILLKTRITHKCNSDAILK